jgi:predicted ATPase
MKLAAKPYLKEIGLKRDNISSFSDFPFSIPAIGNLPVMKFHQDVTFIIGENGSGKSTFIEAVAEWLGLSGQGGSKNAQLVEKNATALGAYLYGSMSARKPSDYFFLRAESLYNVATELDEAFDGDIELFRKNYGVTSLHECSHGESFLAVMGNRLRANGLYLLDEPEAALSPMRQLATLSLIDELVSKNSQFIIATHSPILLAYPHAVIYQFDESGVRQVKYEETEMYQVTKTFLTDPKSMLEILVPSYRK